MIRAALSVLLLALALIAGPGAGFAQQNDPDAQTEAASWERLAERAEALAGSEDASTFAMQRLRGELVNWRDQFLAQTNVNAGRISTVEAQIAALGPVPESGEEPAAVADRRAALETQLAELRAPRLLAQESYARANGIIAEFDARLLRDQTADLTQRGPTPLNPVHLAAALGATWELIQFVGSEAAAEFGFGLREGRLWQVLPRALGLLIVGFALLSVGRRYVVRWRRALEARETRLRGLGLFLLSLFQIAVPLIGLFLLSEGIETLELFGLRGDALVDRLPAAGMYVIFGWWLGNHIFPSGDRTGVLDYDGPTRRKGRRYTNFLAWLLALTALMDAGFATMDLADGTKAALEFAPLLLGAFLFWQLGMIIATQPAAMDEAAVTGGRVRVLVGRFCCAVAILVPLLSVLGYRWGARELMLAAVLTVTLIGVIQLVQRIISELTRDPGTEDETARGMAALIPVLIGMAIYVAALPVFALIWGARVDDLREVWARFREGFTIGETQISPTDFLTFVVLFVLGYLLTRLIQGSLRKSVLPRTRLDLGGQNAVVAGFGYVGIILAAIIAITSAGIDLSNLAIVAGALSVGIGFGMQNIVSNFVSGIILLIERPISEGDWIEAGNQFGIVKSISVRSTRIETFDKTDVIIPNADLVSGQVTNWTRGNMTGRLILPVGVAYGSDVDKVMAILKEEAEANPMVITTPPPGIFFMGFGASSLDFEIRVILRDIGSIFVVRTELNVALNRRFAEEGIEIPFPQRDLWLRNPEALKGPTE